MDQVTASFERFNRGDRRILPPELQRARNETLAALVEGGMPATQAGRLFGLSSSASAEIARLYGVQRKPGRPRNG